MNNLHVRGNYTRDHDPILFTRLKLPLYLHDFRPEIQFGRVEISPSYIAL